MRTQTNHHIETGDPITHDIVTTHRTTPKAYINIGNTTTLYFTDTDDLARLVLAAYEAKQQLQQQQETSA